jgi:hypothetical protein
VKIFKNLAGRLTNKTYLDRISSSPIAARSWRFIIVGWREGFGLSAPAPSELETPSAAPGRSWRECLSRFGPAANAHRATEGCSPAFGLMTPIRGEQNVGGGIATSNGLSLRYSP